MLAWFLLLLLSFAAVEVVTYASLYVRWWNICFGEVGRHWFIDGMHMYLCSSISFVYVKKEFLSLNK